MSQSKWKRFSDMRIKWNFSSYLPLGKVFNRNNAANTQFRLTTKHLFAQSAFDKIAFHASRLLFALAICVNTHKLASLRVAVWIWMYKCIYI